MAAKKLGLISEGKSNAKLSKNIGYLTGSLNLAPADAASYNVCPMASDGCKKACIGWFSGHNVMQVPRDAKIRKTKMFFEQRELFMAHLAKEVSILVMKGAKKNIPVCIRLNCYSDIQWENIPITVEGKCYKNIMEMFPDTQFYDYTKIARRFNKKLPDNYHLTFSRSEDNDTEVDYLIARGVNVAVVFNNVPDIYKGTRVIDGDKTDLRFTDPKGIIVGLKVKGGGKKDNTGFVV